MFMLGYDYICTFGNSTKLDVEITIPKTATSTEIITENTEISKSEEYEHLI